MAKAPAAKNGNVAVFEPAAPPADKNVLVDANTPPSISFNQLSQVADIARVDLSGSDETLAALGAEELGRAEMSVLRAGAYFLQLKLQSGHGGFVAALEGAGVSPNRAQRAMQIARYVGSLPADQAKRIAALPRSKVLPLVNADPEVVSQLLEDGSLDGEAPLSVRDLQDKLKTTSNRAESLQCHLEAARSKLTQVTAEAATRATQSGLPFYAFSCRQEAAASSDQLDLALDLLDDIVQVRLNTDEAKKYRATSGMVAGTVAHVLTGAAARMHRLLAELEKRFPSECSAAADVFAFKPSEATAALEARQVLLGRAEAAKHDREVERENNKPGRVGRKRKASGQ
ncbi:hypothetical protein [Hydrocarboniphaga effusa]|uniref:hypothetical protein n=1 Tax=Hydrocarboniphaga effusa TaxID=243629 RepID=UPI003BAA91E4